MTPDRPHRWPALIVAASFLITFTACGINFAFGVYQELYQSMGGPFAGASPAAIDLIGTLGVSLMTIGAPFAAAWAKAFSPRTVTLLGAVLFGLGNVLASFSQHLWQFVLTQGVLLGCGTCLAYIPAVTVAPSWFDRRRGLAMGIVLAGTGVGGVVWAPVLRALNAQIGFRNTLRLTGGLSAGLIALAGSVLKWDVDSQRRFAQERRSRANLGRLQVPLVNWRIVRSRKFVAHAIGAVLQAGAYYVPIYFFSAYSRTLGYSAATGANFIALSNGASAAGKVVLGYIGDRFGRLNTLFFCTFVSAATTLGLWLPSTLSTGEEKGKVLFAVFSVLYGVFAGAYISLFPIALVELFGVQNFTSINGFLYMLRGLGSLIGTPAAGALLRGGSSPSAMLGYEKLSSMVGTLMAGAAIAVFWVRIEAAEPAGWRWRM